VHAGAAPYTCLVSHLPSPATFRCGGVSLLSWTHRNLRTRGGATPSSCPLQPPTRAHGSVAPRDLAHDAPRAPPHRPACPGRRLLVQARAQEHAASGQLAEARSLLGQAVRLSPGRADLHELHSQACREGIWDLAPGMSFVESGRWQVAGQDRGGAGRKRVEGRAGQRRTGHRINRHT
jgi:hypothetical protein